MKISDLIEELLYIKLEEGDLEVRINDGDTIDAVYENDNIVYIS